MKNSLFVVNIILVLSILASWSLFNSQTVTICIFLSTLLLNVIGLKIKTKGGPLTSLKEVLSVFFLSLSIVGLSLGYDYVYSTSVSQYAFDMAYISAGLFVCSFISLIFSSYYRRYFHIESRGEASYLKQRFSYLIKMLTLCFAVSSLLFSLSKFDLSTDFSYQRPSKVSQATVDLLQKNENSVKVFAFFERNNEVFEKLNDYFKSISKLERVDFKRVDKVLQPDLAKRFKVAGDGVIVLSSGEKTEKIVTGNRFAAARQKITEFDKVFYKSLNLLLRGPVKISFIRGHGEYHWDNGADGLNSFRKLQRLLETEGFKPNFLGSADLMAEKISQETKIIVSLSAKTTYHDSEISALEKFIKKGGSVLVFSDLRSKKILKKTLTH